MGKYSKKRKRRPMTIPVLLAMTLFLACVTAALLIYTPQEKTENLQLALPAIQSIPTETVEVPETTAETVPEETKRPVLPRLEEKAAQNPDMVGWIQIEGTKIDYPLMYTPNDPEKYLHKDFNGHFSVGGLPFLDAACRMDPASDNLLIYGHNMQNGTMFRPLLSYEQKNFWQEHPTIRLSSLYEEKTYEVIAALYDRVYFKTEEHFKFYQFIDATDQASFDEAISYFREHALYDTGLTARYGDKLVTLVTCSYHVDNGRFLVVAREVTES